MIDDEPAKNRKIKTTTHHFLSNKLLNVLLLGTLASPVTAISTPVVALTKSVERVDVHRANIRLCEKSFADSHAPQR